MNYTENYQLNQWEAADRVLRADFNADNAKIDAAIKAVADGGLKIVTGSYTGTGTFGAEHPNTLTFTTQPKLVLVYSTAYTFRNWHLLVPGCTYAVSDYIANTNGALTMQWNGNSISYYASNASLQNNEENVLYRYAAFC